MNAAKERMIIYNFHILHLQGTVFFPLPDGSGLMYNVTGTADAPKPNAKMTRDVPCKTVYTEMLTVTNWLKKPQRCAD